MNTKICYKYFCFAIAVSVWFYGVYFRSSIGPIADVLEETLNTTAVGITMVNSFYYVTYSLSLIPYGLILQYISPKYMILYSSFSFSIASLLFSFSTNVTYATTFSALCGLFLAPAFLSIIKLVEDYWFSTQYLPFMIALQTFFGYNLLFGLRYLQAWIYESHDDWQITYYFFSACSITSFLIFLMITIYDFRYTTQINNETQLLDTVTDNYDTDTPTVHVISVPIAHKQTIFFKLKYAMCNKLNWMLCVWGFCAITIINGFNGLWLINYFMLKFNYTRTLAAFISGLYYMTRAFTGLAYGKLAVYYKKRKIFLIIATMCWFGSIFTIYCPQKTHLTFIIIATLISGMGAPVWNVYWTLSREYNHYYNCKDIASGFNNSVSNLAGFASQLFIAELIDISYENSNNDEYTVHNYNNGFIVMPIMVSVALIMVLLLKETNAKYLDENYYQEVTQTGPNRRPPNDGWNFQ
eukprot:468310_1